MSRKSVSPAFKMFDAASLGATVTSSETNVTYLDYSSIHLDWTGTAPVGVITVEVKNGADDSWYALDFGTAIDITGASGDHQIMLKEMPFTHIRMVYTRTSGTGSITGTILSKVTGA